MRLIKLALVVFGFVFLLNTAQAMPPAPPGKWQCFSVNAAGVRFFQNAFAQPSAMRGAMQRCFAAGSVRCFPGQCYFNPGPAPGPRPWVCMVRDARGRMWQRTSTADSCAMAMAACNQWHQVRQIPGYRCWVVGKHPV